MKSNALYRVITSSGEQREAVKNYRIRISTDIGFLLEKSNKFWTHVQKGSTDECWPWKDGSKTVSLMAGKVGCWNDVSAPRIAIELDIKKILGPNEHAAHTCPNNPLCCNPLHLRETQNWIHNRNCISCGVFYEHQPSSTCIEPRHAKYWSS